MLWDLDPRTLERVDPICSAYSIEIYAVYIHKTTVRLTHRPAISVEIRET